ncbi:hypothetical protein A2X44_04960 [candidate division CPR3 bacterium GWF2_35_18]|uniref:Glycosyltransferase, group 1 family protein n=1 Tax=candidate division CPR3 bacterium GW2011_GWF2_35_18 TaxID=1618350 RepID=A0A0G0BJX0_UNCC3|nr:MAG: Glycosyltransferase, group 1 family protein [candidate division CPR3 bacterium GW2011_GWF2_35_18]KKP87270.1 MAG: Glycosyltransferase, group 1 family protein [candidate division CPR3 bacterium GW2011_GWE2_35_7]OGB63684.1 MAG: hypothetical protein A2X44_04960 [candidate division CPR3 bacterium GWF2_35_18]OGB64996.1 MAG: hypothetical protein A2250_01085 [candidate division CPR3 bacterium RIFOXYA2_FULL_35_13]OGB76593.1 MAG: hypothetical protein A2476_01405 [candidate division CPR3 bacterium
MRIYFIGQKGIPASYGGVEHHVEQLASRLAKKGHEVYVYCRPWYQNLVFQNKKVPKTYQKIKLLNNPSINTKNLDAITSTFTATMNVLTRKADVIHYHGIGPSSLLFIPKLLKTKSRIVATFHCKDYEHQKWSFLARSYLKFGEHVCVKIPNGTIAVSKTIQEYVREKYHKKITYIPNGVPLFTKEKAKNIKDWGLEKDKYILTVARLVKHKNIHTLIKAYQLLFPKPNKTNPKLVIVGGKADGSGQYEDYLKNLAKEDPNIIFTGFQTGETLAELFSNTYLYVHPSAAEGLPIAVLEAMAYSNCVLASNIPENLEPLSDFGFSFKVGNVDDLKEKLVNLLHKPKLIKETGEKARLYVRKKYSWDQIVEKTDEFYENLYHHNPKNLHPKEFATHHWDKIADLTEQYYTNML